MLVFRTLKNDIEVQRIEYDLNALISDAEYPRGEVCAQPPVWAVILDIAGSQTFESCLAVGSSDRKSPACLLACVPVCLRINST